jgi:hypothetical protein
MIQYVNLTSYSRVVEASHPNLPRTREDSAGDTSSGGTTSAQCIALLAAPA